MEEQKMKLASTLHYFFIAILVAFFSFATFTVAEARTKTITFQWEQEISPDFAGWNLYAKQGSTGGGVLTEYTKIATIDYDGNELLTYEGSTVLDSPDNQEIEWFFVLTAFDTDGNESGASNEVSDVIDFLAPGSPIFFRVKINP